MAIIGNIPYFQTNPYLYTNGYTNGRIFGKMIQRMSVNQQILGTCLFHKRIRTYAQHVQTCSNMLLMLNANALSPPKNSMTSADLMPSHSMIFVRIRKRLSTCSSDSVAAGICGACGDNWDIIIS